MSKIIEGARDYADRHKLAEMGISGLTNLYPYSRIYNAEITSYEHGSRETLELVKEYIYNNIDTDVAEELMSAIEKYIND